MAVTNKDFHAASRNRNVKGVRWFTNIDYEARHEELILYKTYSPEVYPKYDN